MRQPSEGNAISVAWVSRWGADGAKPRSRSAEVRPGARGSGPGGPASWWTRTSSRPPVAAAAAPWRAADPRRRVCHVHADRAGAARSFRAGSNGGLPPSVVERASSAKPRSGRADAVNKCGSGSPASTGKCGGRPPHPGHRDLSAGRPRRVHASGTAPPSEPPGRAATGAGAELQPAPPSGSSAVQSRGPHVDGGLSYGVAADRLYSVGSSRPDQRHHQLAGLTDARGRGVGCTTDSRLTFAWPPDTVFGLDFDVGSGVGRLGASVRPVTSTSRLRPKGTPRSRQSLLGKH